MRSMAKFAVLLTSVIALLLTTARSSPGKGGEESKSIKVERVFIHSRSLYVQGPVNIDYGGTVFRASLDKPDVVERLRFPVRGSSKRFGPFMRIAGSEIYLMSVADRGGAQIAATIEKFSFDDLARGPGDYLMPASVRGFEGLEKRQFLNLEPLKDALLDYHIPVLRRAKPIDPGARIQVWFDLSIPGDGFHYLYILNDEGLSVWKRSPSSTAPWEKSLTLKDISPEPFWVANDGNAPSITTASGKVYNLVGQSMKRLAGSFAPVAAQTGGADGSAASAEGTIFFIDDLDSGEQWSLSLDPAGKALTRAHHLKGGALTSEDLPRQVASALQKALLQARAR